MWSATPPKWPKERSPQICARFCATILLLVSAGVGHGDSTPAAPADVKLFQSRHQGENSGVHVDRDGIEHTYFIWKSPRNDLKHLDFDSSRQVALHARFNGLSGHLVTFTDAGDSDGFEKKLGPCLHDLFRNVAKEAQYAWIGLVVLPPAINTTATPPNTAHGLDALRCRWVTGVEGPCEIWRENFCDDFSAELARQGVPTPLVVTLREATLASGRQRLCFTAPPLVPSFVPALVVEFDGLRDVGNLSLSRATQLLPSFNDGLLLLASLAERLQKHGGVSGAPYAERMTKAAAAWNDAYAFFEKFGNRTLARHVARQDRSDMGLLTFAEPPHVPETSALAMLSHLLQRGALPHWELYDMAAVVECVLGEYCELPTREYVACFRGSLWSCAFTPSNLVRLYELVLAVIRESQGSLGPLSQAREAHLTRALHSTLLSSAQVTESSFSTWDENSDALRTKLLSEEPRVFRSWVETHIFDGPLDFVTAYEQSNDCLRPGLANACRESAVGNPATAPHGPVAGSSQLITTVSFLHMLPTLFERTVDSLDLIFQFGGGSGRIPLAGRQLGFRGLHIVLDMHVQSALQLYALRSAAVPAYTGVTAVQNQGLSQGVVLATDLTQVEVLLERYRKAHERTTSSTASSTASSDGAARAGVLARERVMFLSHYSLNEVPIAYRNKVMRLVWKYSSQFLLAYGNYHLGVDNDSQTHWRTETLHSLMTGFHLRYQAPLLYGFDHGLYIQNSDVSPVKGR